MPRPNPPLIHGPTLYTGSVVSPSCSSPTTLATGDTYLWTLPDDRPNEDTRTGLQRAGGERSHHPPYHFCLYFCASLFLLRRQKSKAYIREPKRRQPAACRLSAHRHWKTKADGKRQRWCGCWFLACSAVVLGSPSSGSCWWAVVLLGT